MSAYKDVKKNSWYAKFRYKDWTGQVKDVTRRGFATKREALQWERGFMLEKSGSLDMTFADFVKVYLQDRQPRIKRAPHQQKETSLTPKSSLILGSAPFMTLPPRMWFSGRTRCLLSGIR